MFNNRIKIVGGRDWSTESPGGALDANGRHRRTSGGGAILFRRGTNLQTTTSFAGAIRVDEEVWTDTDGIPMVKQVSRRSSSTSA